MASFKYKAKITENQVGDGVGNVQTDPNLSGMVNIDGLDSVLFNLIAKGQIVNMRYKIQTLDYFNNVIDLHTGAFTSAGNQIVLVEPNSYELAGVLVDGHVAGSLSVSLAGTNSEDK